MIVKSTLIRNKYGLHAPPAEVLAKTAQSYGCSITLRSAQRSADAKSILDILGLCLGPRVQVDVAAAGDDADKAVREICELIENGMGEDAGLCPPRNGNQANCVNQQEEARCR